MIVLDGRSSSIVQLHPLSQSLASGCGPDTLRGLSGGGMPGPTRRQNRARPS